MLRIRNPKIQTLNTKQDLRLKFKTSNLFRVSCLCLSVFVLMGSILICLPQEVEAAKKPVKRKVRRYYRRKPAPFKAYQEYFITPAIKEIDEPVIEVSLKDKGVGSVKFDRADNSIIMQFKVSQVTALDLILALKELGYTVTRIN